MKELETYLKEHKLEQGIKHQFIKEEDDYFKQAVIIMAGLPENEFTAKLITDIDFIFMNNGYKPYDFVDAITNYKNELDELYKKIKAIY